MTPNTYILLVEDNEDDVLLTQRALKRKKLTNRVETVRDGAEALNFLFARGEYALRDPSELPQLVLLDLNLPKLSGIDVLRHLRSEELTKSVPVVMLTTSVQRSDVHDSYRAGANSYVRKPVDSKEFGQAVSRLGVYWLAVNTPPPDSDQVTTAMPD